MNLLDLAVKITCDDQASGEVDKIGDGIKNKLGAAAKAGIVAVAAVGTATVAIGKTALDAYSNYEQLVGGIDTLFKASSGKMQQYAANAYQTAGVSANRYMEISTSFAAALISSLGDNTEAAADMANTAITDMSDNANKMGTSLETVQEAYMSLSRGNYEMLDSLKLGYGGTKSELERLLSDAEEFSAAQGKVRDFSVDSYSDIVEAIHIVQDEMGITGTTAEEAATTIEGSINSAKSAWENWLTGIGDEDADMGALTDQLVQSVVTAGENIIPRFGTIMSNLVTTVTTYAPQIGQEIMDGISQMDFTQIGATASQLILMLVQGIVTNLPTLAQAALQIVMALGQGLMTNGPQILEQLGQLLMQLAQYIIANVPNILDAAMEFFGMIIQGIATNAPTIIATLLDLLGQLVAQVISWAGQMLSNAIDAGAQFLSGLMEQLGQLPGKIVSFFDGIITNVLTWVSQMGQQAADAATQFASNLIDGLASIPRKVTSIGSNIIKGMVKGVTSAAGSLIDSVKGAVDDAINAAKNLLGIHSPSRVFRKIGQYTMQGAALGVDDDADVLLRSTDNAMRGMISTAQDIAMPGVNSTAGGESAVISWLAENLPSIIAEFTPVMGESEFGRKARKAVAYA